MDQRFTLGHYRAINLWGGGGSRRLLRLTFPHAKLDDKTLDFAYSIDGAEKVAAMGFNWVHLPFSWGFAPEIEEPDWEIFRAAVQHYHRVGVRVMGYIQASNCVYQGSYIDKNWYALDPQGNKIHCFTGRYYTSLLHPDWQAEIRICLRSLVETEADGVYFDNPWIGGIGHDVAEMPLGPIGSYDEHSRSAYARAFDGAEIPLVLDTRTPAVQQYLRWRATTAINVLQRWIEVVRNLNPTMLVTGNHFDPITRNSYATMGFDLSGQAELQTLMTIENFAWPRLQDNETVVSNAITIGAVQPRIGQTPVSVKPSQHGVGFERMWFAREFKRSIAEAMAMNTPLVVQGAGFLHQETHTLLLHSRYEEQQQALTDTNHWLEQSDTWLTNRQASSPLAIYHPYEASHWQWNRVSPIFFAACQTLLLNGYPLRIVGDDDDWTDVQCILVPPGQVNGLEERLTRFMSEGGRVLPLGQKRPDLTPTVLWDSWRPIRSSVPHIRFLRRYLNRGAAISWRFYHQNRMIRTLAKRMGVLNALTNSPLYIKPPQPFQQVLINAIGRDFCPTVESEGPVLFTIWREADGIQQWHIVNYLDTPQKAVLHLHNLTAAHVHRFASTETPTKLVGSSLMFNLDIAKIVRSLPSE